MLAARENIGKSGLFLIGVAFICLILMALRFEINWDEFYILNYMYKYEAGELTNPLHTIFVHGFGWIRGLESGEVDQVIAGRFVILTAFSVTCTMLYLTARRFYLPMAALAAVLAYIGFSFVFRSAVSFRVDGLLTACMMSAIWLVSDPKQNGIKIIATGFLIGLSGLFSMKAIFYTPIIAAFLLTRWAASGWSLKRFLEGAAMFTAAVLSFAMLYWLHGKTLPETSSGLEYMSRMGGSSFLSHGLFPQSRAFLISLVQNPVYWILTALGYVAIRSQMRGQDRTARLLSICKLTFAFPLLCLIFYRHSHPYFYVFMLAPVSIFIAASVQHFIIERRPKALPPLLGVLMLWIGGVFFFSLQQGQSYQRQTVDLVHDIFPQPVPYLDYSAMISSFPRIEEGGIFINTQTLDMRAYYRAGQPIMGDILRRHQPKFLIANVTGLDLDGRDKHANNNQLLPSDTAILKDNFTWFWGPLYLPAKSIPADASEIEILVAGDYTYYGDQTTLDGKTVNDRDVITLSQGKFKSQSQNGGILKWGNHLSPPESPAPNQMLFHGF